MIVRILLLLLFFVCCLGAYFLFKNCPKHRMYGVIISTFGVVILLVFVFTLFEINLPIYSKINKETVMNYISNNPDELYECPITYKYDYDEGNSESVGMYKVIKIETDGVPNQSEIEDIFQNVLDELHFENIMIGTSDFENALYGHLCPFFTDVHEKNGVNYYFFPTMAEPYSPRSFLFKGCMYSYSYRNFFAWYHNNVIYIYMEICNSTYGETLI